MQQDPLSSVRDAVARFLETEEGRDACRAVNAIEKADFPKSDALQRAIARYKPAGMARGGDARQIEDAKEALRVFAKETEAFPDLSAFFES